MAGPKQDIATQEAAQNESLMALMAQHNAEIETKANQSRKPEHIQSEPNFNHDAMQPQQPQMQRSFENKQQPQF
jgi:hypothetical protein